MSPYRYFKHTHKTHTVPVLEASYVKNEFYWPLLSQFILCSYGECPFICLIRIILDTGRSFFLSTSFYHHHHHHHHYDYDNYY